MFFVLKMSEGSSRAHQNCFLSLTNRARKWDNFETNRTWTPGDQLGAYEDGWERL